MSSTQKKPHRPDPSFRPLIRSLALELCIYAPLVTGYFALVLHVGKEPLIRLYQEETTGYAIIGLLFILMQGILLEALTSWLLRRIGLR